MRTLAGRCEANKTKAHTTIVAWLCVPWAEDFQAFCGATHTVVRRAPCQQKEVIKFAMAIKLALIW
jgi:hypothetical protein